MQNHSTRVPLVIALLLTSWSVVCAQESADSRDSFADGTELVLSPRAVERPLLKYRLLPAEYELQDGNAAPILLRLPWDQTQYFSTVVPTFSEYLELPLDDVKVLESGNVFPEAFYNRLRRAAYRRTADWEYPIGEEPMARILLPDVQGARDILGRGMSVRIRYLIAHDRLEEAREAILTGLANSRHLARTPFLIVQLASANLDRMLLDRLEELVARPECPNLYWALTTLPRPFIDIRPSIELEQKFLGETLPTPERLNELQDDDWERVAHEVVRLFRGSDGAGTTDEEVSESIIQLADHARSFADLWPYELPEGVAAMADDEVAVRWIVNLNDDASQEAAAVMMLEPPKAIAKLWDLQQRLDDHREDFHIDTLFVLQGPLGVYIGTQKVQRRIDALRVVEAIRNYAATHKSRLPNSLDEITNTPVPDDPLTGKPFDYIVQGHTATLSAPGFLIGDRESAVIDYRIRIRQK